MNINSIVRVRIVLGLLLASTGFNANAQTVCQSPSKGVSLDERIVRCGAKLGPDSISQISWLKEWMGLADLYRQVGDTQRSSEILSQLGAQPWAQDPAVAYDIAFAQGVNGYFSRNYSQSFHAFKRAYERATELNSASKLAQVYNGLGNLSQVRSDYESMIRLLEMASSHYRRLHDAVGLAKVYNNLANAYRFTHRHNLAVSTYRRALQLHHQAGDDFRAAHTQVNMARSMAQLGQTEKARHLLEISLEQFEVVGALQRQIEANALLASIEMAESQFESALDYLAKNQRLKAQLDGDFFDPGSEMAQARYYLHTGQSQLAEALIKKGIEETQKQGNHSHLKSFVKLLAEYYASAHNQAMVNQYLKQHAQLLSDELKQQQRNVGQLSDIFYSQKESIPGQGVSMNAGQLLALVETQSGSWSWFALLLGAGVWCWRQAGKVRVRTAIHCNHKVVADGGVEFACDDAELQLGDSSIEVGRQKLVELMLLAIQLWEQETQTDKLELADRSKIWNVSQDDGRLRVRAMDRYMSMERLPSQPRWRSVVRTCYFVLNHCSSVSPLQQELSQCLSHFLEWEKQKATSI